jgi:hypothetical protein
MKPALPALTVAGETGDCITVKATWLDNDPPGFNAVMPNVPADASSDAEQSGQRVALT